MTEHPADLEVTVHTLRGTTVIRAFGELDVNSVLILRDALVTLNLDRATELHMDLSEVSFLDSTGIGILVATAKRVRALGGKFSTACPAGAVRQILETTGLVEFLGVDSVMPESNSSSLV